MQAVEEARQACDRHRWGDAWRVLSAIDVDELDVDDLDRLATSAYMTGRDEESFAVWIRAQQRCVEEGSIHRAAHFGMKLAQALGFKGDLGRCRGWVDRTSRLLDDAGIDCVEQGYLEHALAMMSLFEAGDVPGAHAHFVTSGKVGVRYGHRELITMARIGEGRMLIYLGEIAAGMALLDEAMASIESGELTAFCTGDMYCTVIDACAELRDLQRCRSWSESFLRWCNTQQELVLYRGHCFLHRAEVLGMLGSWADALDEARQACARLAEPINPMALGGACAIEGDLHRLRGELAEAAASYERAVDFGREPQPGLSLLRLARGEVDAAAAMIRRVAGEIDNPIERAPVLVGFVEILLEAGDVDAATAAAEELRTIAHELGTPYLRAMAAQALGRAALTAGDPASALTDLRSAFKELHALGVRFEVARTRLLIAEACRSLGDADTADLEAAAAQRELAVLGSASSAAPVEAPDGLTQRELEVLRLLASGRTNRMIAAELFISEKTVASHVSHIFTKLNVASRSAATAYAYANDLV